MRQISREMWDKLTPVWDKVRADAMVEPSRGLYASRVGEAAADVNRTFSRARESERRNLASSGIRPGSGRYQSSMRQLGLAQAAQGAGAMTMARRGVDREMEQRRANYLGMSHPLIETMGELALGDRRLGIDRDRLTAETDWRTDLNQLNRELGLLDAETRLSIAGLDAETRRAVAKLDSSSRQAAAKTAGKSDERASMWSGVGNVIGTLGAKWIFG